MGTYAYGAVDTTRKDALTEQRNAMANAGLQGPANTAKFTFFAAFDGTNNDMKNPGLAGDKYNGFGLNY